MPSPVPINEMGLLRFIRLFGCQTYRKNICFGCLKVTRGVCDYLMATVEVMKKHIQHLEGKKSGVANDLMTIVGSMKKQIQQLKGEKSSVATDWRWLITEGFKHVINKLPTSNGLFKPIGRSTPEPSMWDSKRA
ncbi:hypothetical protein QVD17_05566 [Tagetes erecta]|uniref:Uncharacterized protein n=1 Tax=Tagetes erecta TaxID=13708 RepID=A0AAD8LIH9_TARER|nr:hypothetical protein QVD17_05566 [Tagetes erecta]